MYGNFYLATFQYTSVHEEVNKLKKERVFKRQRTLALM